MPKENRFAFHGPEGINILNRNEESNDTLCDAYLIWVENALQVELKGFSTVTTLHLTVAGAAALYRALQHALNTGK